MSTGSWTQVEIAGRRADIFEPETPHSDRLTVLFLHGHGKETLATKAAYTKQLNERGLRCICPDGGQSWWLDVPSPEFSPETTPLEFVRRDVCGWIEDHWGVEPPRLGLLGVSMGGQGVLQLAFREPTRYPVVVAISPAVDFPRIHGHGEVLDRMFPSAEAARQETVVLQLRGMNWPRHQLILCDPADEYWFEGADRLAMKLSSSGALFERDFETTGGGHSWQYFEAQAEAALGFLQNRLEKELRRIV